MQRLVLLILALTFLFSCKSKKPSLAGDETVEVEDFIDSFEELKLPFLVSDTALRKKSKDTILIGHKILVQFVPDTLFTRDFGKSVKPRFFPMGRVSQKGQETYLFLKASTTAKQVGYILSFDKDLNYKAGMSFVNSSNERNTRYEGGMDKRYSIIKNKLRRERDGQVYYQKNVYVYNNAGVYTLILTETNESASTAEIYNPIDTFPRKHKYAADYVSSKRNFISFRDSKRPGTLLFFVHFERNKGECKGELKGEADFIKPNLAHYREAGDPCVLEFSFTASRVNMKELEGCGNHRGIKCFFEGTYPKKKEPKKAPAKPAKKT
jgi:hypothetical protein